MSDEREGFLSQCAQVFSEHLGIATRSKREQDLYLRLMSRVLVWACIVVPWLVFSVRYAAGATSLSVPLVSAIAAAAAVGRLVLALYRRLRRRRRARARKRPSSPPTS